MDELPPDIHARVEKLSTQGNAHFDARDFEAAITVWREALSLLPAPQLRWSAAMWLHASIGDAQRGRQQLEDALSSFQSASAADGGAHNPFVQFCLGATLLDQDRPGDATDPLLRAYMLEGEEIFRGENPKYLTHLRDKGLLY